ncbi:hypothetical protein [Kineothrix sp. MB12-C1]|uniref:hypothetical protein n=1 Tax=Kineothrix sp. MB12-C1 TaxID=3070215 RepID=UPI0027D25B0D|nr:hypothetical protein [Kineothrix sp. MB12-C1]WMC91314.1 hypothetical protein RBB56_10510 [Kineothrix sp. MB12-C1]
MKKMKLSLMVLILVFVFNVSAISTYAATQTMSDGVTFDPQYYAENNPDVVNVYGKTTEKLYQHYVEYGKKEGRKATADSTAASAAKASTATNSAIDTLKSQYPDGTTWNSSSLYEVAEAFDENGRGRKNTGSRTYGSLGWAWLVSDTVQGLNDSNVWKYHAVISTDKNTVKANDVVWLNDGSEYAPHAVFVISVDAANSTFTASEGNGTVNWNVKYSFDKISEVWRMEKDGKGQKDIWYITDGVAW